MFGADTELIRAGALIVTAGNCHDTNIALTGWPMDSCFNPSHTHEPAWLDMYDNGAMDGACDVSSSVENCKEKSLPACPPGALQEFCPHYTYVSNSSGLLNPYFQLAAQYGFANYMFQTNQGPSFPAHQFLFSGTSAPTEYPAGFFDWFAAENLEAGAVNNGCVGSAKAAIKEVDPVTGEESVGYRPIYAPPADTGGVSLLRAQHISGCTGFGRRQLAVLHRWGRFAVDSAGRHSSHMPGEQRQVYRP